MHTHKPDQTEEPDEAYSSVSNAEASEFYYRFVRATAPLRHRLLVICEKENHRKHINV